MMSEIEEILKENERRRAVMFAKFDPVTGEGSTFAEERVKLELDGYAIPTQWVPKEYAEEKLVKAVKKIGVEQYVLSHMDEDDDFEEQLDLLTKVLVKIRCKYDFPFWAITFARIKNKEGGDDIPFRLNRPQRRLVERMERKRRAGKPINIILLKARQWGGSTVIQMYFAWIQLVHKKGWNSTIASHANTVSATVRGMYTKLLDAYPQWMLYPIGYEYDEKEEKITSFEGQQSIKFVPSRNCKIRVATANAQENLRSEDVSMVHCTEVALWPDTKLLHPEDFVDACMSGMGRGHLNCRILESTAKGSGNFFHRECVDAEKGIGDYELEFVSWRDVERDRLEFESEEEKLIFIKDLIDKKDQKEAPDRRTEPGSYIWGQWEAGATLEGLKWYIQERRSKTSHDHMASEAPSNIREAFSATGEELFSREVLEEIRKGCKPPKWIGEVQGRTPAQEVMMNVEFVEDARGELWIWQKPESYDDEDVRNRYLVVVDIGGTWSGADYSVIAVIDRYWMQEGGQPSIVAQWYGHIDHDILAFKAAQIAKYYNNALLVIESNTLDKERDVNADLSEFILNRVKKVYDNLYEREAKEEDARAGITNRYGWHTNRETKPKIIKGLQECVRKKLYVERDERCLDEMVVYEHNGNKYEAKQGYHDDLLMTRAIGLWICYNEMDKVVSVPKKKREVSHYQADVAIL